VSGVAVIRAASGGALRRVVQSVVVLGVLVFSTAAALLALAVLTSANQGFADAFANEHEPDIAVTLNSTKVTTAQLARTRRLNGVTAIAGPYPEATITASAGTAAGARRVGDSRNGPRTGTARRASAQADASAGAEPTQRGAKGAAGGAASAAGSATTFTVVGRSSPSGELHDVAYNPSIMDAVTHGQSRWPSALGEISIAQATSIRVPLGDTITVTSASGRPKLKVVGYGSQTVLFDGGWVLPAEIPLLRAKGTPAREEVFYSFSSAGSAAQISADLAELKRALGAGAIAGSQSYLTFEQETAREQSVNTPFITTFAIIALLLAVLIVANVVAAAVIASYRRIGVLKSIGFTPSQVTAVYLAQIGLPAVLGAVIGAALGKHWALPLIQMAPIPTKVTVPVWIEFAAPLGMLALTGVAAAIPAFRAGRMSAVQAIAAGQAPRPGRGYLAHRLAARLALPRPLAVGLAAPFSRPARSAITLLSITAGLMAVVMATGLSDSIHKINHSAVQGLGQVQVTPRGVRGAPFTPNSRRPSRRHCSRRPEPSTTSPRATKQSGSSSVPPVPAAEYPASAGQDSSRWSNTRRFRCSSGCQDARPPPSPWSLTTARRHGSDGR